MNIKLHTDTSLRLHRRRRPDLQGLRAVAVLAVIAYHFDVPGVPGGFVGVDIFFVLSGFFITRLLMNDIEEHGRIRLGRFWANRAKRLLPNALLVAFVVLAGSAALLPSYRLPVISEDVLSAATFSANFHFADRLVDYFHLDDPPSPLLHYWSLAVEEQFYIVLPLLMSAMAVLPRLGARKAMPALFGLIAMASLAASLIVIEHSQPKAFFLPQYRAWQLALGGLTGLLFDRRERIPQTIRAAGALLGAVGVATSLLLLDDTMAYPGILALAPTLGTATLVFGLDAGRWPSGIGRVLALPLMVWIGDMSYSLYLWHWPVSVFSAALWLGGGTAAILAGVAVTGLLASAAYYFVERPIHHMKLPADGFLRVLATGAAGVALVAGASASVSALPSRSDPTVTALITEATADLGPNYKNGCHRDFKEVDQPECRFGHLGGPRVVLFGDSHAAQWFEALVKAGEETGWEVDAWTKTSCPSVDIVVWYPPSRSIYDACTTWREARLSALEAHRPELVIVANSHDYQGWIYDEADKRVADRQTANALWQAGTRKVVNILTGTGVPVVELRDTPHMYTSYRDCLSGDQWTDCARPRSEALAGMASPRIGSPLYSRLDLSDALCSPLSCPAVIGGAIAYRDSHHLTATRAASLHGYFAKLLAARIVR